MVVVNAQAFAENKGIKANIAFRESAEEARGV
jgi:hypothetical protein